MTTQQMNSDKTSYIYHEKGINIRTRKCVSYRYQNVEQTNQDEKNQEEEKKNG